MKKHESLSNIRQATSRICFISLESTSRKRFKNIRKCPAQSRPHERITPPFLRKKTRKTRMTDLKTRRERGDFIQIYQIVQDLAKVNWCDENKILKSEPYITGRIHPFQLSHEGTSRNAPRMHFFLNRMSTPYKNLTKNIALAHLVNSFNSMLDFYFLCYKVGCNTHIYLQRVAIGEADDLISLKSITVVFPYYYY